MFKLLTGQDIKELIEDNIVTNCSYNNINGTSLDITLGNEILLEEDSGITSLKERQNIFQKEPKDITLCGGYCLKPGEFILTHSVEVFNLPANISCELKLKSSTARLGLENLMAGWCDPGWSNSQMTLELKNMTTKHFILIRPGDKIGQVIFFQHEFVEEKYLYSNRGRYNNQKGPIQAK